MTKQQDREANVLFDAARAANFAIKAIKQEYNIVKKSDWRVPELAALDEAIEIVDKFYMEEYVDPDPEAVKMTDDINYSEDTVEFLCKTLANAYEMAAENADLVKDLRETLNNYNPTYVSKKEANEVIMMNYLRYFLELTDRGLETRVEKYLTGKASVIPS
jgi:hypothetical protein